MKAAEFEKIVGYLGRSHADLVAEKIVPDVDLLEIYPDSDRLYVEPEEGLELTFSADDKILIEFFITLAKTTPSTVVYKGELPGALFEGMGQEQVIDLFGEPVKSKEPVALPLPIGQTGGWASYIYDDHLYPGVELIFQYTVEMKVDTVVFARKI